jgi:hypothetical protein
MGNSDMERQYRKGAGQHDGALPADQPHSHPSPSAKAHPGSGTTYGALDVPRPLDDLRFYLDRFH